MTRTRMTHNDNKTNTSCGPNATLISASRYLQQNQYQQQQEENGTKNDGYLLWLKQVYHNPFSSSTASFKYTHQTFIPTQVNECEGMAIHWGIQTTTSQFVLAVAVRAKGWVAWGLSESGGMKGSDIIYLTTKQKKLYDAYITDTMGLPQIDTRQDWILKYFNSTYDGYLIFEAQRALDTQDAQDWPILNDTKEWIVPQNIIGAWGDTTFLSFHGKNTVQASLRLYTPMTPTTTSTNSSNSTTTQHTPNTTTTTTTAAMSTWVENSNTLWTFQKNMNLKSDASVVMIIQEPYMIPHPKKKKEFSLYSSYESCYSSSKLIKLGFPKTILSSSTTGGGVFIVGIEFLIPERTRPYVDQIHLFGRPNMHNWFLGSCSDHSIGPSFLWTHHGKDYLDLPTDSGFQIGKLASNALSLHIHFNNYDMSTNASGTGVGVRLYYSKQKLLGLGTVLLGDPFVNMAGKLVGDGWTEHSFTCPSSCSDYILLTAPDDGQVTVYQENFYMHGSGKRMVNQILRNGTVIHESSFDYWDFTQSGMVQIRQEPYILKRGDEIRTICYYQSNTTTTTFGLAIESEICIAQLMYYPAQENLFRSICEPDNLLVSVCTEKYEPMTLSGEEDIGRVFGQDRRIYAPTQHPMISPPTSPSSLAGETKAVWWEIIKGFFILALIGMVFVNFVVWAMRKAKRRWEAKQIRLEMSTDLDLL